ncbi:hypothetical protein J6590_085027 [Homalodisca vitripennis]|nr:hypothetical protein J6590_085027 [Homalodisca vitripennis]
MACRRLLHHSLFLARGAAGVAVTVVVLSPYGLQMDTSYQEQLKGESRDILSCVTLAEILLEESENATFCCINSDWCAPSSRTYHWSQQKPMCHSNLGNLMDVQERHITNRKCRDPGVLASLKKGAPPPAYDWRAGIELASPSSNET